MNQLKRPKLEDYYDAKDHPNPSTSESYQLEKAKRDLHSDLEKYCDQIEDAVNKLPLVHDPIYLTGDGKAFQHYGIDCKLAIEKLQAMIK